jgi:hypothetical protein
MVIPYILVAGIGLYYQDEKNRYAILSEYRKGNDKTALLKF